MSDSTRISGDERPISPEWVSLDREAMKARQEETVRRMHEAGERWLEEQRRSEAELQEFLDRHTEVDSPTRRADPSSTRQSTKEERPRPRALIERMHVENLKSLADRHEVPLAPMTLVYGPNSAGKSTVLRGLQMFMQAVEAGRSDSLNLWRRSFPDVRPESVITWDAQPEDIQFSQTRTLKLGVEYRVPRSGDLALAELGFQNSDIGPWYSSTLGLADGSDRIRKEFFLNYEDGDPIDRGDFGDIGPKWEVCEWSGGERPEAAKQDVDHLLFGQARTDLQRTLFRLAGQHSHFGAHRGNPAARYAPVDLRDIAGPEHWGMAGAPRRGLAGFDDHEVLNEVMRLLEIPHSFRPSFTSDERGVQIGDWTLVDDRSGAPVPLSEVGYGVSQLLPVVHSCVLATQRIIAIEEPELHLHPRLQARLANLFALSVLRRGNQVLVETHSESLLLRVRRLVRAGLLRPDEVALLYVDNTREAGTSVRRLRLGEQGELLDPWPSGFFDDSLDDVLGGWE